MQQHPINSLHSKYEEIKAIPSRFLYKDAYKKVSRKNPNLLNKDLHISIEHDQDRQQNPTHLHVHHIEQK